MENNLPKIFTNKAISVATFFGGPLAAGFLISKNFKAFGKEEAARNSIFLGIGFTFIILVLLFLLPDQIAGKIPQTILPAIYTGVIALIVDKLQGEQIKDFLDKGGQKASNWIAAVYGFVGSLIIILFVIILSISAPFPGYQKEIKVDKNVTLHYNKKIDQQLSSRMAHIINQSGFMAGSAGADLFLNENQKSYQLKFITLSSENINDTAFVNTFHRFENFLNFNLNLKKNLKISFTDPTLSQNYELPESTQKNQQFYEGILYLQNYTVSPTQHILYNYDMPIADVEKVKDAVKRLKAYFPSNQNIDIIFLNNGIDYTIKFFVAKAAWQMSSVTERLKSTVDYIQHNGITKKIHLVLIDNQTFEEKSVSL